MTVTAAPALQVGPPYTVDDLFTIPDDGCCYEVLGSSLVVSAAPGRVHRDVVAALDQRLTEVLPVGLRCLRRAAVDVSAIDGPVPDLLITAAHPRVVPGGLRRSAVHTVIEVSSPSSRRTDRTYKRELYAEAGIPCYWQVDLPLIVVRWCDADGWHTVEAAAGRVAALPLAIGRAGGGGAHTVPVRLDPADLLAP